MKRCIIYARIGGPASEVNNSLMQAQLAGLRTTAKGLGLEVVAELPVFKYGTDGNRQSIKTLVRDKRHGCNIHPRRADSSFSSRTNAHHRQYSSTDP